jgi:DNA-binding MarR family transcriptional regulator
VARARAVKIVRKSIDDDVAPARIGPQHLEAQTWYLINRAAQHAREMVEAALEPLGLRRRHYAALGVIHTVGELSQQEISARIPIDEPRLVAVLDDLETRKLARRVPNPKDRRARLVTLTDKGVRLLNQAHEAVAEAERRSLSPLSATELKQLSALSRRILRWS